MGYGSDSVRRVRRQPKSRYVLIAFVLILFWGFPKLRSGWQRRGHYPILFRQVDGQDFPECVKIPTAELERLQAGDEMAVHTYRSGNHLSEGQEINEAARICVVAVMPQSMPEYGYFKDVPVGARGPDSIHLYLNSSSVLVTTPPMRPLPSQPSAEMQLARESILYGTELKLKDPGIYEIRAEREFKNWRWAKQWRADLMNNSVHFIAGYELSIANWTDDMGMKEKLEEVNTIVNDGTVFNPQIVDIGNIHPRSINVDYDAHPDLPGQHMQRCTLLPGFSAEKGRWFNASDFPNMPVGLADEWGFIYQPDECHLDYFTDLDMANCFENKAINVFGDSNSRRLSRSIMSGGRWCPNSAAEDKCQKEDWGGAVLKVAWNALFNQLMEETETPEHSGQFELGDRKPFDFGKGSKLTFRFLQSIALAPNDWMDAFYDPKDYEPTSSNPYQMTAFDPYQIRPGAKGRDDPDTPTPDLVIIAIGSWDEAFDESFETFERTAPYFRDAILEAYPDTKTRIALRLSQGHCCRSNWTEDLRRFTGTRIQHFGDIMRDVFEVEGGNAMKGRMVMLDASGMAGRPEVVLDYGGVGSNHQRAAHARLEAQILYNRLCERDHEGKAVWKVSPIRSTIFSFLLWWQASGKLLQAHCSLANILHRKRLRRQRRRMVPERTF